MSLGLAYGKAFKEELVSTRDPTDLDMASETVELYWKIEFWPCYPSYHTLALLQL